MLDGLAIYYQADAAMFYADVFYLVIFIHYCRLS